MNTLLERLGWGAVILGILTFSSHVLAGDFKKILECDDGAAVVDVNRYDPKYVQVVIRDHEVVRYLKSQGVKSLRHSSENEIIFGGITEEEIYGSRDFQYVADRPYSNPYSVDAEAYREANGLRVVFYNWTDPADGNSDCRNVSCGSPYQQSAAGWFFQSCR